MTWLSSFYHNLLILNLLSSTNIRLIISIAFLSAHNSFSDCNILWLWVASPGLNALNHFIAASSPNWCRTTVLFYSLIGLAEPQQMLTFMVRLYYLPHLRKRSNRDYLKCRFYFDFSNIFKENALGINLNSDVYRMP